MPAQTGGSGADALAGGVGDDDLFGLGGDDTLFGGAGRDLLFGDAAFDNSFGAPPPQASADTLDGGEGADFLSGGLGDDTLRGGDGDDLIVGGVALAIRNTIGLVTPFDYSYFYLARSDSGNDVIDGGAGQDQAFLSYYQRTTGVVVDISDPTQTRAIIVGGVAVASITGIEKLTFTGGSGDDRITGGGLDDNLDGSDGDNQLSGGGGGDVLMAGSGSDMFDGGAGVDTVDFAYWRGPAIDHNVDLRQTGPQQTGAGTDTFLSIEKLTGWTGNDRFFGDDQNNTFYDSAGGADAFYGAGGADSLNVLRDAQAPSGMVLLDGGDGADVLTFTAYGLVATDVWADGGDGDDNIYIVSAHSIIINAGAGQDIVTTGAGGGAYEVSLGAGRDFLTIAVDPGGAGAPITGITTIWDFTPSEDGLRLVGPQQSKDPFLTGHLRVLQRGPDTLLQLDSNGGGDNFATVAVLHNVDAASLTPAVMGGSVSNYLSPTLARTGSSNGDGLSGGTGADTLLGLAGNDVLAGGAASDILDGGAGVDTAVYSGLSRAYAVSTAAGTVGGGPEGGTDSLNSVERIKFVDGVMAPEAFDAPAQVYRIYQAALGRAPDATGLANWVRAMDGGQSLPAVAGGFIGSSEFVGRYGANTDNNQFVTLLYANVLGRTPDAQGLQGWLNYLDTGHTRAEAITGFSESQEFVVAMAAKTPVVWLADANAATVGRLYDTVFGRLPDAGGEINWTAALASGTPLTQVANAFVASQEFQTAYGALGDDAFVRLMYQNVLHRPADQQGLNTWVGALDAGHSRGEVVVGFSESPEHIALTAPHIDNGVWFA